MQGSSSCQPGLLASASSQRRTCSAGDMLRTRAAASSIASGMPSSGGPASISGLAVARRRSGNRARTARARSTNRATAGMARGGRAFSASPGSSAAAAAGSKLALAVEAEDACARWSPGAATGTRSTRSRDDVLRPCQRAARSCRAAASARRSVSAAIRASQRIVATVVSPQAGSQRIEHLRPRRAGGERRRRRPGRTGAAASAAGAVRGIGRNEWASSTASRVLPLPPGPSRVTRRCARSSSRRRAACGIGGRRRRVRYLGSAPGRGRRVAAAELGGASRFSTGAPALDQSGSPRSPARSPARRASRRRRSSSIQSSCSSPATARRR